MKESLPNKLSLFWCVWFIIFFKKKKNYNISLRYTLNENNNNCTEIECDVYFYKFLINMSALWENKIFKIQTVLFYCIRTLAHAHIHIYTYRYIYIIFVFHTHSVINASAMSTALKQESYVSILNIAYLCQLILYIIIIYLYAYIYMRFIIITIYCVHRLIHNTYTFIIKGDVRWHFVRRTPERKCKWKCNTNSPLKSTYRRSHVDTQTK